MKNYTFLSLLIFAIFLSSCYRKTASSASFSSTPNKTTNVRMEDGFVGSGGPVNYPPNIIDGVYLSENIPVKRLIPYEFLGESKNEVNFSLEKNGILTAGEYNDLGNWNLWTEVIETHLQTQKDQWKFIFQDRFVVLIKSDSGCPLSNISVRLLDGNKIVWEAKTDNKGLAQIWVTSAKENQFKLEIQGDETKIIEDPILFHSGLNHITLHQPKLINEEIDIVFAVDATGSMGDEIDFLKDDLLDVILHVKKQNPTVSLNLGSVFYQCFGSGNEYVTVSSDLNKDVNKTLNFIQSKKANGGGDEVVHLALDSAINRLDWRESAKAKLVFLILDEPPMYSEIVSLHMQKVFSDAARKGIKIIPCISSNFAYRNNFSLEFLMRNAALASNGTLVFLTDDSGVGEKHTIPFLVDYQVKLFKEILIRLINENLVDETCSPVEEIQKPTVLTDNNQDELVRDVLEEISSFRNDSIASLILPFTDFKTKNELLICMPIKTIDTLKMLAYYKKEIESMIVYPNPTYGELKVRTSNKADFLELLDASGRILFRKEELNEYENQLDLTAYPMGTYLIRCKIKDAILLTKVQLVK